MKVELVQGRGMSLMAKADSGHWVVMDGPEEFGGSAAATKPLELMLMGLAGCTGMDVISILQKKRVKLEDFRMEVTTDRVEQHPKVFTEINIHFKIYGKNIKEKDVTRAIELSSDTYCAASAMLKKAVPITTSFEIIETE
ncbi:OsmC family protein [bacterium]|nr:OsmC family protein [bacterium]